MITTTNKPEHFCADAEWAFIKPGDPRMEACQCTFERDLEERSREVWRAGPGHTPDGRADWLLTYGGARVWLSDVGTIAALTIDEPPFESTIVRQLVQDMAALTRSYVELYHVDVFAGSTKMHYVEWVAKTANGKISYMRKIGKL